MLRLGTPGPSRVVRRRFAAAALVLTAVPVAWAFARWPDAHAASVTLQDGVSARPGLWRLMRGGLAYLAIPCAMLVAALLVWLEARRSKRDVAVLGGSMILANVLVEPIKHPGLQGAVLSDAAPLSGHVGVFGAVTLTALLVADGNRVRAVALAGVGRPGGNQRGRDPGRLAHPAAGDLPAHAGHRLCVAGLDAPATRPRCVAQAMVACRPAALVRSRPLVITALVPMVACWRTPWMR